MNQLTHEVVAELPPLDPGTYQDLIDQNSKDLFNALVRGGIRGAIDVLNAAMNDALTWQQDMEKHDRYQAKMKVKELIKRKAKSMKKVKNVKKKKSKKSK